MAALAVSSIGNNLLFSCMTGLLLNATFGSERYRWDREETENRRPAFDGRLEIFMDYTVPMNKAKKFLTNESYIWNVGTGDTFEDSRHDFIFIHLSWWKTSKISLANALEPEEGTNPILQVYPQYAIRLLYSNMLKIVNNNKLYWCDRLIRKHFLW